MLCEIAENYFQTLNPIAERISGDIANVKAAYENLWGDLSINEQEQIINETIIHPQVLLKYSLTIQDIYGKSGCIFNSGDKTNVDELTGTLWRDEHSAPFSWKSRSLLELCSSPKCVPGLPPREIKHLPRADTRSEAIADPSNCTDGSVNNGGPFSTFCAKLKLLPGKSCGYQVTQTFDDNGFLSKMKSNAVCKFHNTFKLMGGRVGGPCSGEGDRLVIGGGALIVPKSEKVCGVVAKPTSPPPPPPPPRIKLRKDQAETPLIDPCTPIVAERKPENIDNGICVDLNKNDEPTPLLETSVTDTLGVPKTGFDFLDDW